jgi:Domain of unknown function (DUF4824)
MNFFKKNRTLLLGLGIIIVTNSVALMGVAYNRKNAPESTLMLSERELINAYQHIDNSGIALNLQWQVLEHENLNYPAEDQTYAWYSYSRNAYWLTNEKLKALGFDVVASINMVNGTREYNEVNDREAFLVLELNGPAYQRSLQQVKAWAVRRESKALAADEIKRAEQQASRLFVVDAGKNAESLRQQYPNRKQYAIVKGLIHADWLTIKDAPVLRAYISNLSIPQLHVAKPYDAVFINSGKPNIALKYRFNVAFGQRYEPWIVGVEKTNNKMVQ